MKVLRTYESYIKKDLKAKIKELILRFLYFHPGKNSTGTVENFVSLKLKSEYKNDTFKKALDELVSHKRVKKSEEKATEFLEIDANNTLLKYEIEELGL